MYISIFELFKIGIGPSSSHTVGPINASNKFIEYIKNNHFELQSINVHLYGSLSFTGKGHGTHFGIIGGLLGYKPETANIDTIKSEIKNIDINKEIFIKELELKIPFTSDNVVFTNKIHSKHKYSNIIEFHALTTENIKIVKTYYSIGGGFIVDDTDNSDIKSSNVTYKYNNAEDLLKVSNKNGKSIYEIILENEKKLYSKDVKDIKSDILHIWSVMNKSIYNGMQNSGSLAGGLNIDKRANKLYKRLIKNNETYDPLDVLDWVNIFAIAVAEENASYGRIVTAPTNGAAGIIPAVIKYYKEFTRDSNDEGIVRFLLTASAIGSLYKLNASLSGADAGCQGEIGVACSMAAAGLVAAQNGTNEQIENAAEIGMEHNLGLTCDPINGLVQIPCIERNAMGSIKAINAARISLNGTGQHKVSLDEVIATMWETGKNMKDIYKETSKGGLAVNVAEC